MTINAIWKRKHTTRLQLTNQPKAKATLEEAEGHQLTTMGKHLAVYRIFNESDESLRWRCIVRMTDTLRSAFDLHTPALKEPLEPRILDVLSALLGVRKPEDSVWEHHILLYGEALGLQRRHERKGTIIVTRIAP